jgi:hypothetical protein
VKSLLLAAMLTVGCPAMSHREPTAARVPVGTLIKAVSTADGVVRVYRNGAGCDLWLGGVWRQTVSLTTCTT